MSTGNPDEDIISDLSSASPDEDFDPDEAVKNTQQSSGAYLGGVLRVLEHPPQLGMHKIKYSLNYKHALGTTLSILALLRLQPSLQN